MSLFNDLFVDTVWTDILYVGGKKFPDDFNFNSTGNETFYTTITNEPGTIAAENVIFTNLLSTGTNVNLAGANININSGYLSVVEIFLNNIKFNRHDDFVQLEIYIDNNLFKTITWSGPGAIPHSYGFVPCRFMLGGNFHTIRCRFVTFNAISAILNIKISNRKLP